MKEKSLKGNMALSAIKSLMSVVFPLISFPYVSKVLQVENVGKYNFSNSVISYFILIAGLGISSYAIREGASFREDRSKFGKFANEMFTISIVSTLVAYFLLIVCAIFVSKFHSYFLLLAVLSLQIIFKTTGVEWIYSIFEDYKYITIRSIVFQVISIISLFIFVKSKNDYLNYAAITVFACGGSNILNYIHAKKYCKVRITLEIDWRKHLRPIMVIFSSIVATTIYVSADTTILGFMRGDYSVGLYSVSVKIYSIIKTVLSSVLIVSIPRLSAYFGQKKMELFEQTAKNIMDILITIMLPAIIGLLVLSREIILFISDVSYVEATKSFQYLCVALGFCMFAWFWGQCILLPLKKEKVILVATIVSSIVNIGLNFILIPIWSQDAAAITTIIAEGIAMCICMLEGYKYIKIKGTAQTFIKVTIGCIAIVAVVMALRTIKISTKPFLFVSVVCSVVIYFFTQVILRNEAILSLISEIESRKMRKKYGVDFELKSD
ncbi:oligosaccharide flippase family protein [Clostridium sp. WILCCON 0269]|uniref:Oligosaccharide flippase family protein n=1 Tax=Candidatus Clostridium eludens TaxID=3381663 RepID=A0ABW8SH32_9CLOT